MKFGSTVVFLLLVTGTVTVKGKMTGGQQTLSSNANCYDHCMVIGLGLGLSMYLCKVMSSRLLKSADRYLTTWGEHFTF